MRWKSAAAAAAAAAGDKLLSLGKYQVMKSQCEQRPFCCFSLSRAAIHLVIVKVLLVDDGFIRQSTICEHYSWSSL